LDVIMEAPPALCSAPAHLAGRCLCQWAVEKSSEILT
jgi:hypothetical protein